MKWLFWLMVIPVVVVIAYCIWTIVRAGREERQRQAVQDALWHDYTPEEGDDDPAR